MSTENENNRELGWDDSIENESPEFVLLPAGKCKFEVLDFERQRFAGSAKLPPCNMAVLKIKLTAADGASTAINQNLFLHSITEGYSLRVLYGHRAAQTRRTPENGLDKGKRVKGRMRNRYKGMDKQNGRAYISGQRNKKMAGACRKHTAA